MKRVLTFDFETDPFKAGRLPLPFTWGLYHPDSYITYWGDDCIEHFIKILETIEPSIIYAHNGGKFDFLFLLPYVDNTIPLRIVNSRILECSIKGHVFRDSFAIMPFKLSNYKKDDINYTKLERNVRLKNKDEISKYLHSDCVYLHELVTTFIDTFGSMLTIGGTAMKEIKKRHEFQKSNDKFDNAIRERYYFGGRNQCFASGVIERSVKIFDVNSSYPSAMRNYLHPVDCNSSISTRIEDNTCFVTVSGRNHGAFCVRNKSGLDFTITSGIFHTTIHEYHVALRTGTFEPDSILETVGFEKQECFDTFVNDMFNTRRSYKASGDDTRAELYKYCLNSGYGKFAQNPDNYFDWRVIPYGETIYEKCSCECVCHCVRACDCGRDRACTRCDNKFELVDPYCPFCGGSKLTREPDCKKCEGSGNIWQEDSTGSNYALWKRHTESHSYYNVATGSSITGTSRSILLDGLSKSVHPIYCDTDSIICDSFYGEVDASVLGAWKDEGSADVAAIAGKKLYVLLSFDRQVHKKSGRENESFVYASKSGPRRVWVVKKACKGGNLSGRQILQAARGKTITYVSPAPQFKLSGDHVFQKRRLKRTSFV